MAGTLIYAEVQKGEIKKGAFEIASKAKELGGDVAACVIGKGAEALAPQLAKYGADKIYVVDGSEYENYVPETFVQAFVQVAQTVQPSVILTSASAQGKDFTPAVAARLNVGAISDCVAVTKEGDKIIAKGRLRGQGICLVEVVGNLVISISPASVPQSRAPARQRSP